MVTAAYSTVEYNNITNAGYHGIVLGANSIYRYNYLENICLTYNDGGGLYLWNNNAPYDQVNLTLDSNIIINVPGNTESMAPGAEAPWGRGIYTDDRVNAVRISNNTVLKTGNLGIFVHGGYNIEITNNLALGHQQASLGMQDELDEPVRNVSVTNNVLANYGLGDGTRLCLQQTSQTNVSNFAFATFHGNTYYNPYSRIVARRRIVQFRSNYFGPVQLFSPGMFARAGNSEADSIGVYFPPMASKMYTIQGSPVLEATFRTINDLDGWVAQPSSYSTMLLEADAPSIGLAAALKENYGMGTSSVASPEFEVKTGQVYLLSMLLACNSRPFPNPQEFLASINVRGRENSTLLVTNVVVDSTVKQAATFNASWLASETGNVRLVLAVPTFTSTPLYFQDVRVWAVDATPVASPDFVALNPSKDARAVHLPTQDKYMDVRSGKIFVSSVELEPYQSRLLRVVM
jgi:hypothetical protein